MELKRSSSGQFVKGSGGGGARAGSGAKPLVERELLDKAISPDQWVMIACALRDNALRGCTRSAALLLDRRFGRVKEVLEDVPAISVTFFTPTDLLLEPVPLLLEPDQDPE